MPSHFTALKDWLRAATELKCNFKNTTDITAL